MLKEHQLIYVCHLFGPFMLRLDQERPRLGYDLTNLLYELLEQVDKNHGQTPLNYMDSICDLLYVHFETLTFPYFSLTLEIIALFL